MNAKTLLVLGLAAAALLGAAYVVANQKESAHAPTLEAGLALFPELKKNINSVASIEVRSKDGVIRLAKDGERWGMADKGGYPVDFDKVKQIAVAVSEFEIVSELSRNPDNYKKLGVQAPTDEGSESKQLTLKDQAGAVLADVIIGETKVTQGYGGAPSLFVRPAASDQPYRVTGQVNLTGDASSWMKREICKLESNRVSQVVIAHPDGARLAIKKDAAEDKDFKVEDLPAGEELMWAGAANGIAGGLQYLSLEDVKPASEMTLENPTVAEFTTFDGVRVTVRSTEQDGKTWMSLAAAFDETLRKEPVGPPAPPTPPEGAEGEVETPPTPAPTLKPVEDVRKEVDELNAQFSRWVYAVPGYTGANFRKRMSDLLKKKDAEAEANTPELPEGFDELMGEGEKPPTTPPAQKPPADGAGGEGDSTAPDEPVQQDTNADSGDGDGDGR
jgi:hypothetical protein